MFGAAFEAARRIAAGNRWLVIAFGVLAFLWGAEVLAERWLKLAAQVATLKTTIQKTNSENSRGEIVNRVSGQISTWRAEAEEHAPPVDPKTGLTLQGCHAGERRMAGVCYDVKHLPAELQPINRNP